MFPVPQTTTWGGGGDARTKADGPMELYRASTLMRIQNPSLFRGAYQFRILLMRETENEEGEKFGLLRNETAKKGLAQ